MDILTYNSVKDVGSRIRSFTAGEAITQGQALTSYNGLAMINKRRKGTEVSLNTGNAVALTAICPLSSTVMLVSNYNGSVGQYLYVVTVPPDGSAPSFVMVSTAVWLNGYVIQDIYAITATTALIVYNYATNLYAVVVTLSGTTVTLGTAYLVASGNSGTNSYTTIPTCIQQLTSTTFAISYYGNHNSVTCSGTMTLGVTGTTVTQITFSAAPLTISSAMPSCNLTSSIYLAGAYPVTFTSSAITFGSAITNMPTPLGLLEIDSTHVVILSNLGLCIGTLNAGYTAVTLGAMLPIYSGTITVIDSTHFMVGTNFVTISLSNYSLSTSSANPPKGSSLSAITSYSYIPLTATTLALIRVGGASLTYPYLFSVQLVTLASDGVGGYANNLGIAINTAAQGTTVNVLMTGSMSGIFTNLIPGRKYTNYDGALVPAIDPTHVITLSSFAVASGSFSTIPPFDADNTAIYPYALALSATEILILEPFTMRGVLNT
jgi:hypothetical protein